jgi:chorismate dehydratase
LKEKRLRVGRIPYANLYPIFHCLDSRPKGAPYSFIKGVPSRLNGMLREGLLDISPSSSIEYLRNKERYLIIPFTSISSRGPIRSILLFSKYPVEELGGRNVALSIESETSSAMLRIILNKFYSLKCRFVSTDRRSVNTALTRVSAVMLIGDNAMKQAIRLQDRKASTTGLYVYDLGELWERFTGLPFVYALWLVRKQAATEKGELLKKFCDDLHKARAVSRRRFRSIAAEAPHRKWISEPDLVAYWKLISYDLTDEHMEGLRLFERYAIEISGI